MKRETPVGISEASQILGVSEPALRQWTDQGKIKAFITPGGHRRYSKAELKKLMNSQQKMLGTKEVATQLEGTAQTHREMDAAFLHATLWHDKLGEETQRHLASLGQRLLNLIIKAIAEPTEKEETLRTARDVGCDFGETLARVGFPLADSVQAFAQHHDPILRVVTGLMKRREILNHHIVGAPPLINSVFDEALVSLVTAYQRYRKLSLPEERDTA